MHVNVTVRRATNEDVPDVVRVIRTVYDEYSFPWEAEGYHADLYNLELNYDEVGDEFFVAECDGQVVGTAALEIFDPVPDSAPVVRLGDYWRVGGADCSLERLYVDPSARRLGAGRALFEKVADRARERGRTKMELWSDKKFVDAHRLYERFGARVVGERLCDDPDQSPEWGLILNL
jgi:putative acetyltransferase